MGKHAYNFTRHTYFTDIGCSCCEHTEHEVYNCDRISGSCNDEEDCYLEVISTVLFENYDLEQLKGIAKQLNITINIEDE